MAVCSFLCFCRLFSTAEAAVYMFSMKRCPPGIWPSHKRYGVRRGAGVRRHRGPVVAVGAGRRQGFTRVWTSALGGARACVRSRGSRMSAPSGLPSSGAALLPGAWAPAFLAHEVTCSLALGPPLHTWPGGSVREGKWRLGAVWQHRRVSSTSGSVRRTASRPSLLTTHRRWFPGAAAGHRPAPARWGHCLPPDHLPHLHPPCSERGASR